MTTPVSEENLFVQLYPASDDQPQVFLYDEITSKEFEQELDEMSSVVGFGLAEDVSAAELIIIYVDQDFDWAASTLWSIRRQLTHFLKPVLLICNNVSEPLALVADAVLPWPVSRSELAKGITTLLTLTKRIRKFDELPTSADITQRKLLLLRYLLVRTGFELAPIRDPFASVGYTFPLAQALFEQVPGRELEYLEALDEAQLLVPRLLDKVNTCPQCHHTQINFREICPECRSLDIREESTLHHFRCAYVGRESEFRQKDKLFCPKCTKEVRHIGVDYDKPAEVLWCHHCDHNFAEPLLSCFCLACGTTFPPENAVLKSINRYGISQDGIRAAEVGALPGDGLLNILKKELGYYKYEVFSEYLRLEMARCKRYQYPSTLSRFHLASASKALAETDITYSRKFKKEFASVITQTFRTSDLFTDRPNGDMLIIFTHTDNQRAAMAFSRLGDSIARTFNARIKLEYKLWNLTTVQDNNDAIWEEIE